MKRESGSLGSSTERLVRLEESVKYERERTDYLVQHISRRLDQIERSIAMPSDREYPELTAAGWLKILAAICLPLLVLLVTGDLKHAAESVRIGVP